VTAGSLALYVSLFASHDTLGDWLSGHVYTASDHGANIEHSGPHQTLPSVSCDWETCDTSTLGQRSLDAHISIGLAHVKLRNMTLCRQNVVLPGYAH